jgi:MFS superfamily sulfate permease-like transporter
MRDRFTLHSVIYRLILGAVVLAVVIPVWASGHRPMWPVSLITILVVTAAGILLARQSRLRSWLRR